MPFLPLKKFGTFWLGKKCFSVFLIAKDNI